MSYTLLNPQPENLATNETALDLDGILVAVSVVPSWLPNNAGVVFAGVARHIEADGSPCLCGNGQEIKTMMNFTADLGTIQRLTQDVCAREVMFALLGEPLTTEEVEGQTVPIIPWGDDMLAHTNIRLAAQIAGATGPQAINAANILGL